jgi:chromosome segregation ATPase
MLVNDFNIKKNMDLKEIMEASDFINKHLEKPSQFLVITFNKITTF